MENCVYTLRLPKDPKCGDEITIKAHLLKDAFRFSVNLCLEQLNGTNPDTALNKIAYHLGLHFDEGQDCAVVQGRFNTGWEFKPAESGEIFNDRTVDIVLRLEEEMIKVFYKDTQHTPDLEYELPFPIKCIRLIKLCGDIDHLEEICLKFNQ